jgi:hypothetical protein
MHGSSYIPTSPIPFPSRAGWRRGWPSWWHSCFWMGWKPSTWITILTKEDNNDHKEEISATIQETCLRKRTTPAPPRKRGYVSTSSFASRLTRVFTDRDSGRNQKQWFRGERGPWPPNFGPRLISTDLKRGRVFLAPPNIWSQKDLSPIRDICGVLRRFAAFCGVLRHFLAFPSVFFVHAAAI